MDNSQSDEIDLGQLLLVIINSFNRYKILILTMTIVGGALGVVYFSVKPPVYESSMMLRSDILTEAYSNTLTDNLKKLIDEKGYKVLSQKLNIAEEQASHLRDIEVESVEASGSEDVTKNVIFLISVHTTSNDILPDLENGIRQYLESNEYVKKRIDLKRERLLSFVNRTKEDIQEMDSLKKDLISGKAYNQKSGNNVVVFDPTDIYRKIMTLYKEEISYIQSLELIDSIQLIEGFTAFERPVSPKRLLSIIAGIAIGFFLALAIIFLIEIKAYVAKLKAQSPQ